MMLKNVQSIPLLTTIYLEQLEQTYNHPSQKPDCVYRTFIIAYKTSGEIYHAICLCTAGEGGSRNHVAVLSFTIDDYNRKLPTPSCRSLPSKWSIATQEYQGTKRYPYIQVTYTA